MKNALSKTSTFPLPMSREALKNKYLCIRKAASQHKNKFFCIRFAFPLQKKSPPKDREYHQLT